MAEISVSIAGRQYRMACDDGEEARLETLAGRLDSKIAELRRHFGEIGDQRITVMAALTMVDELSDAERRLARLESEMEDLRGMGAANEARMDAISNSVATALGEVALRIGRIARALDGGAAD